MMWAKERKKGLKWPRMTAMSIFTLGLCLLTLSAFAETDNGKYTITLQEAEAAIAKELTAQGLGEELDVNVIGRRNPELITRREPVVMELADVKADEAGRKFDAVLRFSTEAQMNVPAKEIGTLQVSGRFDRMVDVPVVTQRLTSQDIIHESDVTMKQMPEARLDRTTVRDVAELVGKAPVRGLLPDRPIKAAEVQAAPVVLKRTPVQMQYLSSYVSITAVGTAMQDGAVGERIKVRNDDSGIILDARVVDKGKVVVTPPVIIN